MALLLAALISQEFRTNLPGHDVRVKVLGVATPAVERPPGDPERMPGTLDCVIVGGGLSGLAAAHYLRDLQAVVLERDERAGGLACRGATEEGVAYARGATSYAEPPDLVLPLYRELGLTPLEDTLLPSPVDGWWRKGALLELPPDFKAFHAKLLRGDRIPVQPMERAEDLTLDRISAAAYLREFGPELKACLDAFCRATLGGSTDDVSALAFANAYAARIGPRHAWPGGTGDAAVHLARNLKALLRLGATAVRVAQDEDGVDVDYLRGGRLFRVRARQAILAVPLRVADAIFPGLPAERRELIRSLKYADAVVHQIFTSKDVWTKSYGAWFADKPFTRLIAARWIETKGFRTPPAAGPGILTLHQPLPPRRAIDARAVNDLAIEALEALHDVVPEIKGEKALAVESTLWPASLHLCPPRFFSDVAPKLAPAVGRVRFAGANLGVPSFEEALYRGHRAAMEVREALRRSTGK